MTPGVRPPSRLDALPKEKPKELEFVCIKCEHHVFLLELPGWVKKLQKPCPGCGEEWSGWRGLYSLIGYGKFKNWPGPVL